VDRAFGISRFGSKRGGGWWLQTASAIVLTCSAPGVGQAQKVALPSSLPPAVVVDTDLHFDDLLSLSMLHALADRGELRPIGITISNDARGLPKSEGKRAAYVDAVNTFHGRPDLSIGIQREPNDPARVAAYAKRMAERDPAAARPDYLQQLDATMQLIVGRRRGGKRIYPHDLTRDGKAPDAVPMLRRLLAREPDNSVVLVQIGYATNFAALLDSVPDAASPLSGFELVRRKVWLLSLMGGTWRAYEADRETRQPGTPSTNFRIDSPAARKLFAQWPTPIVVAGDELGNRMLFPGGAVDTDFRHAPDHPIAESYRFMARTFYRAGSLEPYNHKMTDEVSLLYAARPEHGYFTLSEPGRIEVTAEGGTIFTPDPAGRHRYLIQDDAQLERTREAMTLLVTQPRALRP
jgi:inosine-uridine nucleoside N-ribohydrolase